MYDEKRLNILYKSGGVHTAKFYNVLDHFSYLCTKGFNYNKSEIYS